MRRFALLVLTVTALLIGGNSEGHAAKRIALVIGINDYPKLKTKKDPFQGQLRKAVADAETMAVTLRSLKFEVEIGRNVDRAGFLTLLDRFKRKINPGDTAFIFYAGHGIALKGSNLLLPSDMPPVDPRGEQLVRGLSIAETDVINVAREKGAGLTILVLDACRNNPIEEFARRQAQSRGRVFRSTSIMRSTGLDTRPTKGIFAIYSAGFGQLALDGLNSDTTERNSVFTRVFAKRILEPGRHLPAIMEDVREEVALLALKETDPRTQKPHLQYPAYYNETLGGKIFLAGRPVKVEPTVESSKQDDGKLAAIQKELKALKGRLAKKPEAKHEPQDDGKLVALQQEIEKLKAKLAAANPADASPQINKPVVTAKRPPDDSNTKPPFASQEIASNLRKSADSKQTATSNDQTLNPKTGKTSNEQKVAIGTFPRRKENATPRTRGHKPGNEFQDCPKCPEMVVVPAGSFTMGAPDSEIKNNADERPQHTVRIPQAFAVGKFEVSFAEWDACEADGDCLSYEPTDEGWGRGRRPVINVSWWDAKRYVDWLSFKTGRKYRLLSEAQWEYVARAGTTTPFSTGDRITTDQANFDGNRTYNGSHKGHFRNKTVEVGSFTANDFGVHDMHGNAWEWVEDCYVDNYRGVPTDGSAHTFKECEVDPGGHGEVRVLRGGSWYFGPGSIRSAARHGFFSLVRDNSIGFRVARTLTPEELK